MAEGVGATVGLSVTRASVDVAVGAGAVVVARAGGLEQETTTARAATRTARDKVRIDGA